ncbi:unnamed protein product [Mytilus coruscus]|uniref:Mutator-like transposase domain-containing protein n=1 Tax=Mytilus coruscus TaxID=42192 RepID=A0A6J8F4B6_MYTCO|nr:unnamed protein product [Mytilus coruscus]
MASGSYRKQIIDGKYTSGRQKFVYKCSSSEGTKVTLTRTFIHSYYNRKTTLNLLRMKERYRVYHDREGLKKTVHNIASTGGVAVIIGAETKKILHIGIRNTYCYICNQAATLGIEPLYHICYKNWNELSQAIESDIIVEGFLKANDHGVRYMEIIGDGDSSVMAKIMEKVPVWGCHVKKIECSNHACKCLKSNLEKLVVDNPAYKGKGRLCKNTRIRLTSAVGCAIGMRSLEEDRKEAIKKLEHDIRNSSNHIYGEHSNCSNFCKAKTPANENIPSLNIYEEKKTTL